MPEARSKSFAEELLKSGGRQDTATQAGEDESRSKERQVNAFNLSFRFKNGRRKGGISWGHYVTYEWDDEGDHELLSIIMGMQVVEVRGYNLEVLIPDVESGQLKRIRENNSREVEAKRRDNPENDPIIVSIDITPSHKEMKKRLTEEEEHETGFAKRARG